MADRFAKVEPGDPLRIPAEAYNTLMDVARDFLAGQYDLLSEAVKDKKQTTIIKVRNDSGDDRESYEVLKIDSVVHDETDNLPEFQQRTSYSGTVPETLRDTACVLLEPCADGRYARAVVAGVTTVLVNVTNTGHEWANPSPADATQLTSGAVGLHRIIYKPGGTGSLWCKVRLADSGAVEYVRCTSTTPTDSLYPASMQGLAADGQTWSNGATVWFALPNGETPTLNTRYGAKYVGERAADGVAIYEGLHPVASAQVQTGSGAPVHTATEGTPYWDTTNNILYINSDGGTTWIAIVTGQAQTGFGTPVSTASEGTIYWDTTNNILYVNNNGSTGWTPIEPGQAQTGSGPPVHTAPEGMTYWDTTNNILYVNNNGSTGWEEIGAGTVTSVGLVPPDLMAVTGSPLTSSGDLTLDWTGFTSGDLMYATAAATMARRAIGTEGQVLTVASSLPVWATVSGIGGAVPMWVKYVITYTDLSIAATTNEITIATLPARSYVMAAVGKHTVSFTGGSIASYTITALISDGGTDQTLLGSGDVFQAVDDGVFGINQPSGTTAMMTFAGPIIKVAASASANLDTATQGSFSLWLLIATLPA